MAEGEKGAESQPVITTSEGEPGELVQPDVTQRKGFLARLFGGRSKKPEEPVEQAAISTTPVPDQSSPQAKLNPFTPAAAPEAHTTPEVVEPTPTLDTQPLEDVTPPSSTSTLSETSGPEITATPQGTSTDTPVKDKAA